MAARIRSLRNFITPVDEASRDDLVTTDVVTVTALDAATTYAWSIEFAPAGSTATFSGNPAAVSPGTFTVDLVGPYLIRLTIDAALPTEDTQYVRLRALTTILGLKLVSAGERRDETGTIPVDVSTEGWANDQNYNLQLLEAAIGGGTLPSLQVSYDGGNTIVLADAATPVSITAGAVSPAALIAFYKSSTAGLGSFTQSSANVFRLQAADGAGANPGNTLELRAGDGTAGVQPGGSVLLHAGAGNGAGADGSILFENPAGQQVALNVTGVGAFEFNTAGGGGLALAYDTTTGKLTVPGLIDPIGMIFEETASTPTTTATEGALFVSTGAGSLAPNVLYYVPESNGTPRALSLEFGLLGSVLHRIQLEQSTGNIQPAAVFGFDATVITNGPSDGDTLVINNGVNPAETYTFKTVPAGAFDVQINAGDVRITLTNLADTINSASTQNKAIKVTDLTRLHASAATRGHAVVITSLITSAGSPRLYGTFAAPGTSRPSAFDFSLDQSRYAIDNNWTTPIDTSDPGVRKWFGYQTEGVDALPSGTLRTTVSDPSVYQKQNNTPTTDVHWTRVGPDGAVVSLTLTGGSASRTLTLNERRVVADLTGGSTQTVVLPKALFAAGMMFGFRRTDANAASSLVLDGNGAETIDGAATLTVGDGEGYILFSTGSAWVSLATFGVGGGGGGGTDTYTPPDVYFVDPALAIDATKRQYQTIAGALAAASGPTTIWLSPGPHTWDGSDLATPADDVEIAGIGNASISFALVSALSSDDRLKFRNVVFDIDTNAVAATGTVTVVTAPLAAGDTVVVNGLTLTGVAGARTSGSQDFDASLGTPALLAAEIATAWNDPGNFLNTDVTAIAVGSTVTFTSVVKGAVGNAYTLSATTTPPGGMTASGATLSGGQDVDIAMGINVLSIETCSGALKGTSVDCPTPVNKAWEIVRSDLALQMVGDATEVGDGSVGGTLTVTDSIVRDYRTSPLWDQDASSVGWYFLLNRSQVWVTQAHDPIPLWRNNLSDLLLVTVAESLLRLEPQGFAATVIIMSGGSVGPNWIASRVVAPPFEGSGNFSFGDLGTQQGLEIEAVGELPLDAIDGTRAHKFPYGQLVFESYPPLITGAWKGDGRKTYLTGSTPTVGVWYDMPDVFDSTRTVTEFSFPSIRRLVRIRGEVVVQTTGAANDGAVFPVDAVLYLDSSGGGSTVFKLGDIPVASFEDTPGRFLVQLIAVTGGSQEGFTVQVQTATGTVAAGSPSWRAALVATESYV